MRLWAIKIRGVRDYCADDHRVEGEREYHLIRAEGSDECREICWLKHEGGKKRDRIVIVTSINSLLCYHRGSLKRERSFTQRRKKSLTRYTDLSLSLSLSLSRIVYRRHLSFFCHGSRLRCWCIAPDFFLPSGDKGLFGLSSQSRSLFNR